MIDRAAIARTYELIAPHIRTTPVVEASGADFGLSAFPLSLKLELFQHAGSFKTRGAFANLLTRAIPVAGVAAASGGNHGAVAYRGDAARRERASKCPRCPRPPDRAHRATAPICGDAPARSRQSGLNRRVALPSRDREETLLGGDARAGLGRRADLTTLLVSVGGGGLIASRPGAAAGRG
jgi:threonine dehydratase